MFKTAGLLSTLVILKLVVVCVVFQLAISYLHIYRAELPEGWREVIIVAESPRVETLDELIEALERQIAASQMAARRTVSGRRVISRAATRGPITRALFPRSLEDIVQSAGFRYGVDPNLVWGVIKVESNFNSRAVSRKGARGLMQLMPATARMHNVRNIHDPSENIHAGVRYLRHLLDRFDGNLRLALAAYNAGPGVVEKYKNIPPYPETRKYVRRVLKYYRHYRAKGTLSGGTVTTPKIFSNTG